MLNRKLLTDALRADVQSLFGRAISLGTLGNGEDSEAYALAADGGDYVLRLNENGEGFGKDALAYKLFARPGLPIPQVVHLGDRDGVWFCLSRRLPGRTLQDTDPSELSPLLAPTAQALASVASSDISALDGFGPFDSAGHGRYESWFQFLTAPQLLDDVPFPSLGVDRAIVKDTADAVAALAHGCGEVRALIHGDFGSNNVLAEGGAITGVLDWSEAAIGDGLYDIANIFFWCTWLPCMEEQARYFERQREAYTRRESERLLCYGLRIGLAEICSNAREKRLEPLLWATERCRQLLG